MKLKNWIRRSFRNRIFATILVVTLMPLLLCDVVMMRVIVARTEHTQAQQGQETLHALCACFDNAAALCSDTLDALATSTITRSVLRRTEQDSRLLYQFLYRRAAPLRPYAALDIYNAQGVCLYTTDTSLPAAPLDTDWGALYAARSGSGTVFLSSGKGLLAARTITAYGGQLLGYVTVRMDSDGFAQLFDGLMAPADDLLVLDGTWRTVYYTRTVQADRTVAALRGQLLAGQSLTGAAGDNCTFYTASGAGGFTLLLQQSRIYTGQVLRSLYLVGAALGFLCLALCAVAAWWLSRYLSRPVNALDDAMRQVERGDYDAQLHLDSPDELGRLAASFNRMTEEYRQNLERSVQRQKELNETQLRMLQAQLNPHFLYNTLESIHSVAYLEGNREVGEMAVLLARILRYGVSDPSGPVTLRDEAKNLDDYIRLQELRYHGTVRFAVSIDPGILDCACLRMILQPIVENALYHGVTSLERGGQVQVLGYRDGENLVLRISDNGQGMEEDRVRLLNDYICGKNEAFRSIGLKNVSRRIRLCYGEDYGVLVQSAPGRGTMVTVTLPVRTQPKTQPNQKGDPKHT